MIQTTMAQVGRYAAMHPAFAEAFRALREQGEAPWKAGVTEVDGKALYINALAYETREAEPLYEAHRQYVDVMYLLEGEETVAYCPLESLDEITTPYDADGDALLGRSSAAPSRVAFKPGDVAIFFPEDAHCPGLRREAPAQVKKLIAKVRL